MQCSRIENDHLGPEFFTGGHEAIVIWILGLVTIVILESFELEYQRVVEGVLSNSIPVCSRRRLSNVPLGEIGNGEKFFEFAFKELSLLFAQLRFQPEIDGMEHATKLGCSFFAVKVSGSASIWDMVFLMSLGT